MSKLVTRLFKLERDVSQRERFDNEGQANLLTSIDTEPGTLAMYATHLPDDPATCYVFEVYASEDAYQVHAASPQFKAYAAMAMETLTGREIYQLVPELMIEKPDGLRVTEASEVSPRCCFVEILPNKTRRTPISAYGGMARTADTRPVRAQPVFNNFLDNLGLTPADIMRKGNESVSDDSEA